jgi:hypothetical protein
MRARQPWAAALLAALLVVGACGGGVNGRPDGGPGGNGGSAIGGNVGHGGSTGGVGACLDRPGELARPPTGQLPCDLIPPGLRL